MAAPLVPVVDRRLGEQLHDGLVVRVYVVDLLACGHEAWISVSDGGRPYALAASRRCDACGGTAMGNRSSLPDYRLR